MNNPEPNIRVNVDPTNPGQFFACCGLLELADRLWEGAEGWFECGEFRISAGGTLADLMSRLSEVELLQIDPADQTASPIEIGRPFRTLRLDWWCDEQSGGKELKVWAGRMESFRIARAMQRAMRDKRFEDADMFNIGCIVYDPANIKKKVEPFYFDARRGPNAHSRDVGFSPNDLQMTTTAFPAVEFFCLVGLQRCLPVKAEQPRMFEYHTWTNPLAPALTPAAVCGLLSYVGRLGFRFENWYRTGQKKHKAFRSSIPLLI